jgi:hypothetical protein
LSAFGALVFLIAGFLAAGFAAGLADFFALDLTAMGVVGG